jgi:hypothetical protein
VEYNVNIKGCNSNDSKEKTSKLNGKQGRNRENVTTLTYLRAFLVRLAFKTQTTSTGMR